jgi:hypothetical protein
MDIVELLKVIGILYLSVGVLFGLISRYSSIALSKVANISIYSEHSIWSDYIIKKKYLGSNNITERVLGKLNFYSGKVIKYFIISIPFTVLVIATFVIFWLVSS